MDRSWMNSSHLSNEFIGFVEKKNMSEKRETYMLCPCVDCNIFKRYIP
jgi:hypothetical protein